MRELTFNEEVTLVAPCPPKVTFAATTPNPTVDDLESVIGVRIIYPDDQFATCERNFRTVEKIHVVHEANSPLFIYTIRLLYNAL